MANSNSSEDYYQILGVSRDATQDEITAAYRKLAKQWHPDVNKSPEATEMFEKITRAYEVLKDPQKRKAYDQFGEGAVDESGASGFNASNFNGFQGGVDFDDIFNQFFGGGFKQQRRASTAPRKGGDIRMKMRIDFMDAVKGRTVDMPYSYEGPCKVCGGCGAASASDIQRCPTCGGSGYVTSQQSTFFGAFTQRSVCSSCGGSGQRIANPCYQCRGSGTQKISETLKVNVPAGVDEGDSVRVPGRGQAGAYGGPNGDLYIQFTINPSKVYRRDGLDLHVDCDLPLITAILGGQVTVQGVDGDVDISVKSGTQPSSTERVKGGGIHSVNGRIGDLIVHYNVKVPTRLNAEEKSLYTRLGEIAESKGEAKGLFSKMFNKRK